MRHFLTFFIVFASVFLGYAQTTLSPNSVTICSGQNISVTASNPNSSYTFTWSSGTSTQTGSMLSLTNVQVSQNWVCTTFDGSNQIETDNLTITVNQTPVITSSTTLTTCSGISLNYNITSSTPSSFVWSANSSLNINGETEVNSTTSSIVDILTNLVSTNQTVTYSIIPTSQIGNCIGSAHTLTVTVVQIPAITSPSTHTICSGSAVNYNITANPPSSFSWVAASSASITGESITPTNSSIINNGLTSSNLVGSELVTYTINPTSTLGSCVGAPLTLTVTVSPTPVLAPNSGNNEACVNTTTSLSNSQASGTWSSSNTLIATIHPTTGFISALAPGSTTITYTYENSFNCTNTANTPFTVNSLPAINSPNAISICSGETLAYTITSNMPSSYSWQATNNPNIVGESISLINSSNINDLLTTSSSTIQNITYTIIPISINEQCVGMPFVLTVTLKPTTLLSANSGSSSVCVNGTTTLSNTQLGGIWSSSNTAIASINSSSGVVTAFIPGTTIITYTYTNIFNCTNSTDTPFTVNALPQNFLSNDTLCLGQSSYFQLNGFVNYLWYNGSTDSTINITPDESGYFMLTVLDTNGCVGVDTTYIQVNPVPQVPYLEGPQVLCTNALNQIFMTNPSNNLLFWEVEGGHIYSGQYTNIVHIDAVSQDTILVNLMEQFIATGCGSTSSLTVVIDPSMTAPAYVDVILLGTQNDFLCAPQATNIFRWGKIDKQTNDIYYYVTTDIYYNFNFIDITNYYYFVDHGQSACFTRSFYNEPPITAAINEEIEIDYSLAPNPVLNDFIIQSKTNELIQIQIQDIQGKVIFEGEIWTNSSFDFSTENPGIYFVSIRSQTKKSKIKYLKL
jgi:hypothetical protein